MQAFLSMRCRSCAASFTVGPIFMITRSVPLAADVVDAYSRFILPFFPFDPSVNPPESEGAPAESLSRAQKDDLVALLQRL
jgi:hypothetical protein